MLPPLPSPEIDRYRNKVQFPVGCDKNGKPCIGFYAGRTHRIVPCPDCKLQPDVLNEIGNTLCDFFAAHNIQPYDEQTGKGLVRHVFLRRGVHSGQIMVCLVCTRAKLPHAEELCRALTAQFSDIATILINVNARNTNVILGSETHTLYGPGFIEDTLCGVPVQLGPLSFYQVNTLAAEQLYGIAAEYAQLTPDDLLLDLYCGMGTIGLSMADHCRELIGVEIVPEAIESAKANAARMGDAIAAKSRFFCADAGKAASQLAAEGLHPDVVMLDPPRKGCDEATLSAVVTMSPRRVVYVSCNPSTAARDAKWLEEHGYRAEKVQPVDLFPRTRHVETVCLLSKLKDVYKRQIYVSPDSSDLWTRPELFQTDGQTHLTQVAGCPPDAFAADGQLWGNPLYDWPHHKAEDFAWWKRRMQHATSIYDVVRIDHFRGFESYYAIPAGNKTAAGGHWEKGPDRAFINAIHETLGQGGIIAEDLGYLTPEVKTMLAASGYPGMKIMQFAFDSREPGNYLPYTYTPNSVVYTGTHDNVTTEGWRQSASPEDVHYACRYLRCLPEDLTEAMICACLASVSDMAIIPMADWLHLGAEARINTPSTQGANWQWRLDTPLTSLLAEHIADLTALYDRAPAAADR